MKNDGERLFTPFKIVMGVLIAIAVSLIIMAIVSYPPPDVEQISIGRLTPNDDTGPSPIFYTVNASGWTWLEVVVEYTIETEANTTLPLPTFTQTAMPWMTPAGTTIKTVAPQTTTKKETYTIVNRTWYDGNFTIVLQPATYNVTYTFKLGGNQFYKEIQVYETYWHNHREHGAFAVEPLPDTGGMRVWVNVTDIEPNYISHYDLPLAFYDDGVVETGKIVIDNEVQLLSWAINNTILGSEWHYYDQTTTPIFDYDWMWEQLGDYLKTDNDEEA